MAAVPPPVIIGLPFAVGMLLQWLVPIHFPPRALGLMTTDYSYAAQGQMTNIN